MKCTFKGKPKKISKWWCLKLVMCNDRRVAHDGWFLLIVFRRTRNEYPICRLCLEGECLVPREILLVKGLKFVSNIMIQFLDYLLRLVFGFVNHRLMFCSCIKERIIIYFVTCCIVRKKNTKTLYFIYSGVSIFTFPIFLYSIYQLT
jgi:hypothetical protein